jgi:hypothetical protein
MQSSRCAYVYYLLVLARDEFGVSILCESCSYKVLLVFLDVYCASPHPDMYVCIHACMHTCRHAYVHAYMKTCIQAYMHTSIHVYIHTYIHTCIHSCIHAYIHTLMHLVSV